MKDIGRMICSMDRVYKYMQMETSIKECLNKAKEADKVLIIQPMGQYIVGNGSTAEYKGEEYVNGKTVEDMKDHGWIIRSMVMVFILGLMVENIKETIKMIKNMVQALMYGLMEESMSDNGKMIKDMVKANIQLMTITQKSDYGKMIKE